MPLRPSEHLRKHGLLIAVGGLMFVALFASIAVSIHRAAGSSKYTVVVGAWISLAVILIGIIGTLWSWFDPVKTPTGPICRKCGYDLRATPDRCPECGTAVKRAEA